MKELRASMDLIRKTAGDFIENMTEQIQALQKTHLQEKTIELEIAAQPFDEYQRVELFDVPALFANGRVALESLPEGIYRYELRGSDYDPGYPITVEKNVMVSHAATILTAVPLNLPEQGHLRIGEELNMTEGMQDSGIPVGKMSERDLTVERERENAIGRANESLYLSGRIYNRDAIYQIAGNTKGRSICVDGNGFCGFPRYDGRRGRLCVYLWRTVIRDDTLDSLYLTFNINHPEKLTRIFPSC